MSPASIPARETETKVDILIVDDNPRNLLALEAMLEPLGQNIVRAESGTQALRHLLEHDFALALLDIQMPDLDGFDAAEIIRGRERSRHMPIIFLTAFSSDDAQVSRAYELGAVAFLFKPIVPLILRSKVMALVDLSRQALEIKRQAELLREVERREHERALADAAQRWEAERLREEMLGQRANAAALSLRNLELASADRRKDEFLAMLAHELRNPMAPIVNAVELLRTPGASTSVVERALDALDRQTSHMVRLVDDLLDVSRIATGKIELRREPVTLASIVSHAIQTSAPLMARWEHRFEASLPDRGITLHADGARISQVVVNLLSNAARYSPPRSKIDLKAVREGDEVVIRVRDQGIGISPDMLEATFGLFVQLDRTTERAQGGLGIGLALVKALVEMHGGSVSAYSAGLGEGSEFTVRLPIAGELAAMTPPSPEAQDAPAPLPVHASPRAYRVMVVEDNDDIRECMKNLLEAKGYEALVACDGPSGLEAVLFPAPAGHRVHRHRPPWPDPGTRWPRRCGRARPTWRRVSSPLTGYGRPEDRQRALAAGFDDHAVKPLTAREILRLIEEPRHGGPVAQPADEARGGALAAT